MLCVNFSLSLMTDRSCIEWMKSQTIGGKTFLERWILNDTPQLKIYSNRPVGNSPEMMPWDCSLNKDVLDGLNRHVLLTKDYPKKFSLSTPKNIDHAIKRLVFRSTLNNTGFFSFPNGRYARHVDSIRQARLC
jgi:hypothetical protein